MAAEQGGRCPLSFDLKKDTENCQEPGGCGEVSCLWPRSGNVRWHHLYGNDLTIFTQIFRVTFTRQINLHKSADTQLQGCALQHCLKRKTENNLNHVHQRELVPYVLGPGRPGGGAAPAWTCSSAELAVGAGHACTVWLQMLLCTWSVGEENYYSVCNFKSTCFTFK